MADETSRRIDLFADDLFRYFLPRRIGIKVCTPLLIREGEKSDFHAFIGMSVLCETSRSQGDFFPQFIYHVASITESKESYFRFCASYSMDLYFKNKESNIFKAFIVVASMILELGVFCHLRNFKHFKYYSGLCFSSVFQHFMEEEFYENGGWESLKQYVSDDANAYIVANRELYVNETRTEYKNDWLRLYDVWAALGDPQTLLNPEEASSMDDTEKFTSESKAGVSEECHEINKTVITLDKPGNVSESKNVTPANQNLTKEKQTSLDLEKETDLNIKDDMYVLEEQKASEKSRREQLENVTNVAEAEEGDMVLKSSYSSKDLQNELLLNFKDIIASSKDPSFEELSIILESDSNINLLMNNGSFRYVMRETVQNPDRRFKNNDILQVAKLVLSGNEIMVVYCCYVIRHLNQFINRESTSAVASKSCNEHDPKNMGLDNTMKNKASESESSPNTKSSHHLGAIPKRLSFTTKHVVPAKLLRHFKRVISKDSNPAGSEIIEMFKMIPVSNILLASPIFRNIMELTVKNPKNRWENQWILSVAKKMIIAFSEILKKDNTQESSENENKTVELSSKQVPKNSDISKVDKVESISSSFEKLDDSDPILKTNTPNNEDISSMEYQKNSELVSIPNETVDIKAKQDLEVVPELIPDSNPRYVSSIHTGNVPKKETPKQSASQNDLSSFSSPRRQNNNTKRKGKKRGERRETNKSEAGKNIEILASVFKQFTPSFVSISVSSHCDSQKNETENVSSSNISLSSSKGLVTCEVEPNKSGESNNLPYRVDQFRKFYNSFLESLKAKSVSDPSTESLNDESSEPKTGEELKDTLPKGENSANEASSNVSDKPKSKSQIKRDRKKRKRDVQKNCSQDIKSETANIAEIDKEIEEDCVVKDIQGESEEEIKSKTDKEIKEYLSAKNTQAGSRTEIESTTDKNMEYRVAKNIHGESGVEIESTTETGMEHDSFFVSQDVIKSSDSFTNKENESEFLKETNKVFASIIVPENKTNITPSNFVSDELMESCKLSSPKNSVAITGKVSTEYFVDSPIFHERSHTWLTEMYPLEGIAYSAAILESAKITHSAASSDSIVDVTPVTPTRKSTPSKNEPSFSNSNSPESKYRLLSTFEKMYDLETQVLSSLSEPPENNSPNIKTSQETIKCQTTIPKNIDKASLMINERRSLDNTSTDIPTLTSDHGKSDSDRQSNVCDTDVKFEKLPSNEISFNKEIEQEKLTKHQNTSGTNVEKDGIMVEILEKFSDKLLNKINTDLLKEIVQREEIESLSPNNSSSFTLETCSKSDIDQEPISQQIHNPVQFLETFTKLTIHFLNQKVDEKFFQLQNIDSSQNTTSHKKSGSTSLKAKDKGDFSPSRNKQSTLIEASTASDSTSKVSQEENNVKLHFDLKTLKDVKIITASESLPISKKQKTEIFYESPVCLGSETRTKVKEDKVSVENQNVNNPICTALASTSTTDSDNVIEKYTSDTSLQEIESNSFQPKSEDKPVPSLSNSSFLSETCNPEQNMQLQKTKTDLIDVSEVSDTSYNISENQKRRQKYELSENYTKSFPKDNVSSDLEEKMVEHQSISNLSDVESTDITDLDKDELLKDYPGESSTYDTSSDLQDKIIKSHLMCDLSVAQSLCVTYPETTESSKDDDRELTKYNISSDKEDKMVRYQSSESDSESPSVKNIENAASHSHEIEDTRQHCPPTEISPDVLNAYENALKSINLEPSSEVSNWILHKIVENNPGFIEVLKKKLELDKKVNSELMKYRDLFHKNTKSK